MSLVAEFIADVVSTHSSGNATEGSYRPALKTLFEGLAPGHLTATNEPKRTHCGAPDFIIQSGEIAIGYVEAKDLPISLKNLKGDNREQKERYLAALPNMIYTNCLDWEFYRDGQLVAAIEVGEYGAGVHPKPDHFAFLENLLRDFVAQRPQTITSPKALARMMAGKAGLIRDVLQNALHDDEDLRSDLGEQFRAFRQHLIHNITVEDFSDIYAETVAYGMFAARLHDTSLESFSRQEALELLPKSNPFLRSLFTYIAGPNLDDRIRWIIDDLAKVFQAANVKKILQGFGKLTGQSDPFLHFYETFLAVYNPKKRKACGVWYTPEPVVEFIVRAVDDILQSEFGLADGVADTSRISIDWDTGQNDKKGKPIRVKKDVHRVQILDPATGTGTFLAEVVKRIASKVQASAPGLWSGYVEQDLVPRVHGFELLMASYAMCHLKLDMILTELGYKPTQAPPRLSVYLTNSLEEGEPANQSLPFAQWLSYEVKQANAIKRDLPIMCVIGNPPYSIRSGNMAADQVALVEPYRAVDGIPIKEKGMLQFEKNINNDYIKFIALAERLVSKSNYGIMGFITSHGYLKSASFKGLRAHLMKTFDCIRILDLHGNSEIREVVPAGVVDKNVFDIKQGVAIVIAYRKSPRQRERGRVFYAEMWGSRESKYDRLAQASIADIDWAECAPRPGNYTFHPSGASDNDYDQYVSLPKLMPLYSSGVITARDDFVIADSAEQLVRNATAFATQPQLSNHELCRTLGIAEKKGWDVTKARSRLAAVADPSALVHDISYRPFDTRKILFDESVVWTTARSTMNHMLRGDNLALISARSEKSGTCSHFFVSPHLVETKCGERTTQSAVFPLFCYPAEGELEKTRRSNFDTKLYAEMRRLATHPEHGVPDEYAVFDYIYGVLHCPAYREAHAERLKIDFPRIPWPASPELFWDVSRKGTQLRRLHLMEPAVIGATPYPFQGEGDGTVDRPRYADGQVWINDGQYFADVPEVSWNFFIGGYQPARKWLKDRKGERLNFAQIGHYRKIVKVLAETDRIMKTITLPLGD